MLIEIFNDRVYESTLYDLENGATSRHIPYTYITEKNDKIANQYDIVKNFIIDMLDKTPGYNLRTGGYYAINITRSCFTVDNLVDPPTEDIEFKFLFDKIGVKDFETIIGKVVLYGFNNDIRLYTRSVISSSPGRDRFTDNDHYEPNEGHCVCANEDDSSSVNPPIELSPNSFSESTGTIEVSCPEMEIGTVKESTLSINEKRQAAQDAFLRQMNSKFGPRK